ncbi:Blp family class II bacteriocin [Latilactobacillus fuchuensis]|uniref:Uncharacterized protein n=1 Tax=Latilactobacillus fuchuensis TaxID=164393 RepID=A0A2N9DTW2_9LACO|nr:Blp family class II bacteriocin [Latilactobacillus fuchuensis]SPC37041.1 conserved hypothetical protein [Latilactobacillus fuchuensis]
MKNVKELNPTELQKISGGGLGQCMMDSYGHAIEGWSVGGWFHPVAGAVTGLANQALHIKKDCMR